MSLMEKAEVCRVKTTESLVLSKLLKIKQRFAFARFHRSATPQLS